MIYIENIFVCLAIPLLLSLLFIKGESRRYTFFVAAGMLMCMLSAYVNSFFMASYKADEVIAAIEITPVCEEIMKLMPLLFYFMVLEPEPGRLASASIALGVGFATFENACYMTANGAEDLSFLLMRGLSAGALHILSGIIMGFGLSYVFRRSWLAVTGTAGLFGVCVTLHALYNLMITADTGPWRAIGYAFPAALTAVLFIIGMFLSKMHVLELINSPENEYGRGSERQIRSNSDRGEN